MIERIFIRPPDGPQQLEQQRVQVVAGVGIRGDRYFDAHDEPGQNISFVEAEAIEAFARRHGRELALSVTGRNVVTRGVRLNELVGQPFMIGGLRFRGVDRCHPCLGLGEALAAPGLPPADVVRQWLDCGGLRADVLSSGELAVGDTFGAAD